MIGDLADGCCSLWGQKRVPGLARVAEQGVHSMPPYPRNGIVECADNVRNRPCIGMLIEKFEAASANHRARVCEAPDESVDLLRG